MAINARKKSMRKTKKSNILNKITLQNEFILLQSFYFFSTLYFVVTNKKIAAFFFYRRFSFFCCCRFSLSPLYFFLVALVFCYRFIFLLPLNIATSCINDLFL